jgi:glutamyl-tRNA synthetase
MSTLPHVGRLAPSPTGGLHLGHARTFLHAWLDVRKTGGRMILRIEDIDASRCRPEAVSGAIDDLRWLGLDWDEGPHVGGPHAPYLQSLRCDLYDAMLKRLKDDELVYPCTCTRSDIARAASAPHPGEEGPVYPGTCSQRSAADAKGLSKPYSWRFRVYDEFVTWHDAALGLVSLNPSRAIGDFIVGRSTGEPAYQLAVVVDDAAMGITRVVRGDDLASSTPRQILLYRAIGFSVPKFAHLPLVYDAQGKRLAKRNGSVKLATLREQGVDPRDLIGRIIRSSGPTDCPARTSPAEILEHNFTQWPLGRWTIEGTPM